MKILKIKKFAVALSSVILMSFIMIFSTSSAKIDYTAPIPLGVNVDLIEGLSEEEAAKAKEAYYNGQSEAERIYENFLRQIDQEKYFAGAYWEWEGDRYILDENGEKILDENGKPLKNKNQKGTLHIMVTDMKIIPKEINHPNIIFIEAKYSFEQLSKFADIIINNFPNELAGVGKDTKENKIDISFLNGFDINKLKGLIPDDAYIYNFVDDYAIGY